MTGSSRDRRTIAVRMLPESYTARKRWHCPSFDLVAHPAGSGPTTAAKSFSLTWRTTFHLRRP